MTDREIADRFGARTIETFRRMQDQCRAVVGGLLDEGASIADVRESIVRNFGAESAEQTADLDVFAAEKQVSFVRCVLESVVSELHPA